VKLARVLFGKYSMELLLGKVRKSMLLIDRRVR
jgi:hypothetical protein